MRKMVHLKNIIFFKLNLGISQEYFLNNSVAPLELLLVSFHLDVI